MLFGGGMADQTRNHSVAGVVMVVGAAVVGFASTQPWVAGGASVPWGPLGGLGLKGSMGFDVFVLPGGESGNVQPLILGGAAVLLVMALLLFVTRAPGVGIVWRVGALATALALGIGSAVAWSVVKNPASVVDASDTSLGGHLEDAASLAQGLGVLDVRPGAGLWLLTVGTGIAAIAGVIPAIRGQRAESAPSSQQPAPGALAGWYPDQLDPRFVRYFDGTRWTPFTQPRE